MKRHAILGSCTALAVGMFSLCSVALADAPGATTAVTVPLSSIGNSGVTGIAALSANGDTTGVSIRIQGAPADGIEPVHIHSGTCVSANPVPTYPLKTIQGGTSDSVVAAPLSVLTSGTFVIEVFKSPSDLSTVIACGSLTQPGGTVFPSSGGGGVQLSNELALGGMAAGLPILSSLVVWYRKRRQEDLLAAGDR